MGNVNITKRGNSYQYKFEIASVERQEKIC